ncbi:MAG: hypothetical protein IT175_06060 [Acidobacteria bacterium]|nr:hypothetical protein [Acidobacteriota bacterium]
MTRSRSRWFVWSTRNGLLSYPEPLSAEMWRELKGRPRERSGCGNWQTVYDEDGLPALVLVRYRGLTKGPDDD